MKTINHGEQAMERDRLGVHWHLLKGKILEMWGELTGDDMDWIAGRREQLIAKLEEKYGMSREEAEGKVEELLEREI